MPKVIKPGAIHLRMFAGFCFNNIFCAATNLVIDSFLAQFKNEEMTVMSFWRAVGLF